ncbi:MAG: DUF192 domain-containing protein [Coriobacteriia bacterium]|nr:DUF192 domain-containing protein [Coriobacteriia bacterium]
MAKLREPGLPGACLPEDVFPAGRVMLATRLSSRLRGLLFAPESDDLMVLLPCHDIHTFGMGYALDIAFLDASGRVLKSVRDVLPNRRLREPTAVAVLERRAIPREVWFEEGDRIGLGHYRRTMLPDETTPRIRVPEN